MIFTIRESCILKILECVDMKYTNYCLKRDGKKAQYTSDKITALYQECIRLITASGFANDDIQNAFMRCMGVTDSPISLGLLLAALRFKIKQSINGNYSDPLENEATAFMFIVSE